MQATAYYNGDQVSVIDFVSEDKVLIISSHNPIETEIVKVSDLNNIRWIINTNYAG